MSITSVHELFFSEKELLSVKVEEHKYVNDDEKECRNVRFEIEGDNYAEVQISIPIKDFIKLINAGKGFLNSEKAESV